MNPKYPAFPLVLGIGQVAEMEIAGVEPGTHCLLRVFSRRQRQYLSSRELQADEAGHVRWQDRFPAPGEYLLDLVAVGAQRPITTASVMIVSEQLARRRPLRADFHIHTHYSNGSQASTSPTGMAVRGRELGLDVIAITDHDVHPPSMEGKEGAARLGLGILCLPGEEISFPSWHVLAVGTTAGVVERFGSEAGKAEVAQIEAQLAGQPLAGGLSPAEYAPLKWAIQTVHCLGGRAYLAHPYWTSQRGCHLDLRLYAQLVADGELDGVELIGDVDYEDNVLSIAHYHDLLAAGHRLPILGNSDTHGVEHTYGGHWTLLFAEETTGEGVLRAIEEGYSVACTRLGPGNQPGPLRLYGSHELVEYGLFLERAFFPLHDALCRQEAALTEVGRQGGALDAAALARCQEQIADLYRRAFPAAT